MRGRIALDQQASPLAAAEALYLALRTEPIGRTYAYRLTG